MAYTGITATEAQIDQKTGAGVSASYTDTMKTQALLQAECFLNAATRHNYSDEYTTLDADTKHAVTMVTAAIVAMEAIGYDTSGYIGEREAETKLDILNNQIQLGLSILRDKNTQTFLTGV